MDASEVSGEIPADKRDATSAVAVDGCSVHSIFEWIFDEAMSEFKDPLDVLKKNEYSFAWKNDRERHDKTMAHARMFVSNVIQGFRSKHGDVAVAVEGSACEAFHEYFTNRLNADTAENMLEQTFREIKVEFTRKISMVKESLEKEKGKQPKPKSVIENMICKTDLFDPIHIHHVLLCCRVAQKCEDLENPGKSLNELGEKHLLSEIVVSYENDDVPKYLMARCGDVLYVTFRGLHFTKIGCSQMDWRGQICQGINAEAQKIPLGYFAREIYQKRRIIFSGHSTGGTIAALVVIYLLDKFKQLPDDYLKSKLKCITLGLLPVGDETLKKYVESIPGVKDCFNHIVKKDDIVPSLCGMNWNIAQDRFCDAVGYIPNPLCYFDDKIALNKLTSTCKRIFRLLIDQGIINLILPTFDIFGMYYILDPTANDGAKYQKMSAEKAKASLTLDKKSVIDIYNAHLLNHKLERYDHEVRMCLIETPPLELEEFSSFKVKKFADILPNVSEVTFENIGDQVVAKIAGSSMWFVYRVSIENDIDLPVDSIKTRESEVQLTMPKSHLLHASNVSVRVKTHFHNAKYLKSQKVTARTMTYNVSRRQEQLAKLSPCDVIELAYLSALLERRSVESDSKRYEDIKTFFEAAVSVVPIESLFHAMATASTRTVVQCCQLYLCADDLIPSTTEPSQFLLDRMKEAIKNIGATFGRVDTRRVREMYGRKSSPCPPESSSNNQRRISSESAVVIRQMSSRRELSLSSRIQTLVGQEIVVANKETAFKAVHKMKRFSSLSLQSLTSLQSVRQNRLCGKNLASIYPSSEVNVNYNKNGKPKCCKTPMTLLISGRNELDLFSEQTTLTVESNGDTDLNSNTLMLEALNNLRKDFETCSTLLGAFMEAQVQVPLEMQGNRYVDAIAKTAKSFGLDVWGLLILPFHDLQGVMENLPGNCQRLIVEVAGSMYNLYDLLSVRKRHLGNYNGKLEFLITSMKQSSVSNREFVTYSLERQLDEQCKKRNISSTTPLDEILQQWQANFQDETLTFVPDRFRPLVARWIKWSLMINRLRESIAEQTAVGVIGLVNSGKSKFVRSIFGIKAITGTTAVKRTTVPFIYNLEPQIKGLDVIDFPGVDDQDKSIPELAKLLLSLTRLVVFVVDYKRAHTESTKEWLGILEKENVPVLICLSFADKLYAELMGEEGTRDVDDLKDEIATQLKNIKDQIGQPEIGTRDFKFVVFAFDNDSKLNCEDGKDKLRQAGLNDELDVGQWIAEKLEDNKQSELSQEILKFIEEKKTSTLNFHKMRKPKVERQGSEI